jgi:hypothetical protein
MAARVDKHWRAHASYQVHKYMRADASVAEAAKRNLRRRWPRLLFLSAASPSPIDCV